MTRNCVFPTDDQMANQLDKVCPSLEEKGNCRGCFFFETHRCPLEMYSSFRTAARLANWKLWKLEI